MKRPSLLLSLAILALPSVATAQAYEAPEAYCHDAAEAAYQLAIAQGDGLPDAVSNRVQANCDYQAFRAHLVASHTVSLNELIAFDHDGESWLLEGVETPSEHEMDRQDALRTLCPEVAAAVVCSAL